MSDESWDIAPPPFNAESTMLMLKRFVRDQHVLAERGDGWTLNGSPVLKLVASGDHIAAQLAKRPAQTPEWETFTVRSAPEARKLQDEIKRRLMRWKGDSER